MNGHRVAGAALAGLLAPGLAACESSQTKSARLAKSGAKAGVVGTVSAGAKNASVKVGKTTILRSESATAVVVELTNTGADGQVAVPIQIDVKDAKGVSVYKNDVDGLQPSLQQLALLPRGEPTFWVNDQVTAATPAKRVNVDVGKAGGKAPPQLPEIRLEATKLERDESGAMVSGVVKNLSKLPQINMPIYAVVRRGGKVVAAGRALVEKLNPEPQAKPTTFSIFLIGDPAGGKPNVRPYPTVLKEGS